MRNYFYILLLFFSVSNVFSQSIVITALTKNTYCQGDSILIHFSSTGSFNPGNVFSIELGNSSGLFFSTPLLIGSKSSATNGNDSICGIVPIALPSGMSSFSYRIVSSLPVVQSSVISGLTLNKNPIFKFQLQDTVFCITEKPYSLSINAAGYSGLFTGEGVINNSFTPSKAGVGNHYLYSLITNTVTNCFTKDSCKVLVNETAKPVIGFSEKTTVDYSVSITALGDSIIWFVDSTLTNYVFSGNTIQYIMSDTGAHYLYPTQTVNNCQSNPNKITIIYRPQIVVTPVVKCLAKVPSIEHNYIQVCFGDTILHQAKAHKNGFSHIEWFDGPNLYIANKVSNDSIFTFRNQNRLGPWIYYAVEHDTVAQCYSKPIECDFYVHALPQLNISIQDTICFATRNYPIVVKPSGGLLTGSGVIPGDYNINPNSLNIQEHDSLITLNYSYADSLGCLNSLNKSLYVRYVKLPRLSFMNGYLDSIPQLFASRDNSSNTIHWYSDANSQNELATGIYYHPTITAIGEYTYYVSQESKGCKSDIVPLVLTVTNRTTESTIVTNEYLTVYPIPSNDFVHVQGISDGTADLFSIQGAKIVTVQIINGRISFQNIPSGMYFLACYFEGKHYLAKVIKE